MTNPSTPTPHTIDEALDRFTLVGGTAGSPDEGTACVMTALSWVAGESWTDHPNCAHPILTNLAIRANDHDDTTPEQRADIVRAGETGLIDTRWLPGEVVAWCIAEGVKVDGPVPRCLETLAAVTAWKANKVRPNLRGAYLGGAYLRDANLVGAYLRGADCNQFTVPPAGWTVNTATWRLECAS